MPDVSSFIWNPFFCACLNFRKKYSNIWKDSGKFVNFLSTKLIKLCSHLTPAFAFFFDLCHQMQTLSMNTIICCHGTHSWSLTQTQTQTLSANRLNDLQYNTVAEAYSFEPLSFLPYMDVHNFVIFWSMNIMSTKDWIGLVWKWTKGDISMHQIQLGQFSLTQLLGKDPCLPIIYYG